MHCSDFFFRQTVCILCESEKVLPHPEIFHVNRQYICNILSSRLFLWHIYSGQNDIPFNGIVLFLHLKLITIPITKLYFANISKSIHRPQNIIDEKRHRIRFYIWIHSQNYQNTILCWRVGSIMLDFEVFKNGFIHKTKFKDVFHQWHFWAWWWLFELFAK